jgi:adenosylcobyric acid synthase
MLGKAIHDPHGIEGEHGSSDGLALLTMETTLEREKQLRNVRGRLGFDDADVTGYEIHAGISTGPALARPALQLDTGPDGAVSSDSYVIGSYVHGLFESHAACNALLTWAGMVAPQTPDYHALREAGIERLADTLESHLDIAALLALLGTKPMRAESSA